LDGLRLGQATWHDRVDYGHDFFDWLTPRYTLANYSPFGLTEGMFNKILELMGTPEQQERWLVPAKQGHINGAFVQTELGHGTFLRGLETTATFSSDQDCFILNSPTVTSTKYWPGSLAFSASHGIVMAKLIIHGKDYGVHPFVLQLRDTRTGKPTPGIELGDVGLKPSHNQNDNGYARFNSVMIPRENMLMGQSQVSKTGKYTRDTKAHPKATYATMMSVRSIIVWASAIQLAASLTIATRYSLVREQGYSPYDDGKSVSTEEMSIIDYKSQQYRLLAGLATAYAILFSSKRCRKLQIDFEQRQARGDFSTMATAHAITAGMKAWATTVASEGAEDARKCCGGAGYLAISGLPEQVYSLTVSCTLEGENYVLWQQTARYLVQWANRAITSKPGEPVPQDLHYLRVPVLGSCPAKGSEFLNKETQMAIFRHRAQRLIRESASKFDRRQSNMSKPDIWNEHMMLLISTARAHIEYQALESFIMAVEAIQDMTLRSNLSRLCSLFALSSITSPLATGTHEFLEDGYLSLSQLHDIRNLINDLLRDLLPEICGLTDAWDFTDAGLCSAIGMEDGNVYERLLSWTRQLPINLQAAERGGVQEGWETFIKPALRPKL
jgi:acyl-CoA oxidase